MIFNLFVGLKSRSGINTHADAMKRKIMLEQQFPGSRYERHYPEQRREQGLWSQ